VLAGDAVACTCAAATPKQRLDSADAAFVGRLIRTEAAPETGAVRNLGREITFVFRVDQVVKGELGRQVAVQSPASGAACGFGVQPDKAVGILLRREGEEWIGGLCGQIAVGELVEASRQSDQFPVNWGGVVVGTLVLGLGALVLWRRVRRRQAALLTGSDRG
jgi:hypothetical protein